MGEGSLTLGIYEVFRPKGEKFGEMASRAISRISLVMCPERNAVKRERSVARGDSRVSRIFTFINNCEATILKSR